MSFQGQIPRLQDPKLRVLERDLMAHRYLYYVLCRPVISDTNYDMSDRHFQKLVPEDGGLLSVLHHPGSDLESSYTQDEITLAQEKLAGGRR